jgi:hypothetical protein
MLPLAASRVAAVDVVNIIPIEIVLVVDRHVSPTVPIAISPVVRPRRSEYDACSKCESHPWCVARIIIRWIGINGWAVNDCRIIRRNIDVLRVGWLNCNDLTASFDRFGFYFLLLGRF